jgi:hypothetical protein
MIDKNYVLTNLKYLLNPSISSNKIIYIFFGLLFSTLILDSSLLKIYSLLNSILNPGHQYFIFILIVFAFTISQYFILAVVRDRIKKIESTNMLINTLHKIVIVSQYIISLFLILIILDIFFNSHYNTLLLLIIALFSYGLCCISLGLLSVRFFLWFRSKGSYNILIYCLSLSLFVISSLFVMIFIIDIIPQIGDVIQLHGHITLYYSDPGSFEYIIYNGYLITSTISFIATWIATAIILHVYSNKIGNLKYWILISLPLVYFLSQFFSLFSNFFYVILKEDLFLYMTLYYIIFSISKVVGGIQFGIAFWVMVRQTKRFILLRNFLIIVAIGFVLLFVSEQAVSLISFPYPPFGLISVATLGLSSYLILIGLYYSAVTISQEIKVRKFILTSALNELYFLRKIGSAQVDDEMEKIIGKLVHQNIPEITPSIGTTSPENIKLYIDDIMDELQNIRENDKQNK